jgi:hypothetical protein
MTTYAPTTELEAVNIILATVGDAPVNTLTNTGLLNVDNAVSFLHEASRQVQSEGWHFNTELNYTIEPNVDGHLVLPLNTLRVENVNHSSGSDFVMRNGKLYDRINHSYYVLSAATATVVLFLPYTDLPEDARHYIKVKAARVFQDRMLGSTDLRAFSEADEVSAREALLEVDTLVVANRLAQAEGWHFNTDPKVTLSPDANGKITVPTNTLRIDPTPEFDDKDVVVRSGLLYNRTDHTFIFDADIDVEMIALVPFPDLSDSAKQYVRAKANRMFHDRIDAVGVRPVSASLAQVLHQNALNAERLARAALVREDDENGDYNMFTDSFSVSDLLNRSI